MTSQDTFGCNSGVSRVAKYLPYYLWLAYKKIEHTCSIAVSFGNDVDLFDLRRLNSISELSENTSEGRNMQMIVQFSVIELADFKLRMLTFFIDGSKLKNVTRLKYLGSIDIVLSKTTLIFLEHGDGWIVSDPKLSGGKDC